MPLKLQTEKVPRFLTRMQERVSSGIGGSLGQQIAAILRTGPGSVDEQFTRQALDSAREGRRPWDPVGDFGSRSAPSSALQRTGSLRRAWRGQHPASITQITATSVTIGVSRLLPAAATHQYGATVKARRYTSSGRPVMQLLLGMEYGIWLPRRRLERGLRIPARPVGISTTGLRRVSEAIARHIAGSSGSTGAAS